MEHLEDELRCPVCLELFEEPLSLRCSHSICKGCLEDIIDSRHILGEPRCPTCRKEIGVRRENIAKIPVNLALRNIIALVKNRKEIPETKETKTFDDLGLFCTQHLSEKVSMFCECCDVTMCRLCVCRGAQRHSAHMDMVVTIETAQRKSEEVITKEKFAASLHAFCICRQTTKSDLQHMVDELEEQGQKVKKTREACISGGVTGTGIGIGALAAAPFSGGLSLVLGLVAAGVTATAAGKSLRNVEVANKIKERIRNKLRGVIKENRDATEDLDLALKSFVVAHVSNVYDQDLKLADFRWRNFSNFMVPEDAQIIPDDVHENDVLLLKFFGSKPEHVRHTMEVSRSELKYSGFIATVAAAFMPWALHKYVLNSPNMLKPTLSDMETTLVDAKETLYQPSSDDVNAMINQFSHDIDMWIENGHGVRRTTHDMLRAAHGF